MYEAWPRFPSEQDSSRYTRLQTPNPPLCGEHDRKIGVAKTVGEVRGEKHSLYSASIGPRISLCHSPKSFLRLEDARGPASRKKRAQEHSFYQLLFSIRRLQCWHARSPRKWSGVAQRRLSGSKYVCPRIRREKGESLFEEQSSRVPSSLQTPDGDALKRAPTFFLSARRPFAFRVRRAIRGR